MSLFRGALLLAHDESVLDVNTVGRNDPCPCGSGKKYKYCHLGSSNGEVKNQARIMNEELAAEMAGHEFASIEEVQSYLDAFTHERNTTPLAEFHGLSPEQMFKLIYFPFDSPEVVTFPEVLDSEPSAPICDLFMMLAEELREGSIKLTDKGNLPRALCRSVAQRYLGEAEVVGPFHFGPFPVNKEADFKDLQVTRVVAGFAGLVRKYRGRLELTRKGQKLLEAHGARGVYPVLLRAYVEKYNWAHADSLPELDIVQRSWAFTAYLLTRYGGKTRPSTFYSDQFLLAYPNSVAECDYHWHWEPEEVVAMCYDTRAIQRFAEFLGLVRIESDGPSRILADVRVTKLPLLGEAVRFAEPDREPSAL